MNHAYRPVFNAALGTWVAAPETARSHGRGRRAVRAAVAAALVFAAPHAFALDANALPSGGQISAGSGTINQSGATMTVSQQTQNLALNWQSFNIGGNATVNFIQPNSSAIALNRVLGSDPSQIYGHLNANGQVFLLNPNGVLFGKGAQVNVGGLVASTQSLSDADFLAKNYRFTGSAGSVINQGSITAADGGYVALLGGQVSNQGTIVAKLGNVSLAAGSDVTLDFAGDKLISVKVNQGTFNALAENKQLIVADGGTVLLTAKAADALISAVVNNEGVIEAHTVSDQGGVIRLLGDVTNGIVLNTGTVDASQADGTAAGTIAMSGRSLLNAGKVSADGEGGAISLDASFALLQTDTGKVSASGGATGGSIRLNGGKTAYLSGQVHADGRTAGGNVTASAQNLSLAAATLSADGQVKGGTLLIGGDAHGAALTGMGKAITTRINDGSVLSAQGQGGKIVVWSDGNTQFSGNAKTGPAGFIEISAKGTLTYSGRANAGLGGKLLLDPTDIVISKSSSIGYIDLADPSPSAGDQHGSSSVTALANGNIVVASANDNFGGTQAGAAYLYNGSTGALISALHGSASGDHVGSGGVTVLNNGNYVVRSLNWANGSAANAGAATWASKTAGVSGVVSSTNSLVGSTDSDQVGSGGIMLLSNGNYVVISPNWSGGTGAVTWGSSATGISGAVADGYDTQVPWGQGWLIVHTPANSLLGSAAGDHVGSGGVIALVNGNYLVRSPGWDGGAGAVTWGNGTSGVTGHVDVGNSLVGGSSGDNIGSGGITLLSNGNYVVVSPNWSGNQGAVTWGSGAAGVSGGVGDNNSLVGSNTGDYVGSGGVKALTNGNYVIASPNWSSGYWDSDIGLFVATTPRAGAVTWGNGTTGITGTISSGNSLIGGHSSDLIGNLGITALPSGNYVVLSNTWNGGYGAATWGNGGGGTVGVVSSANSLVSGYANSNLGLNGGITVLSNGNYVVSSPFYCDASHARAGAVTWGSGTAGVKGVIDSSNSLIGGGNWDMVGSGGVTALSNGNYVVSSPRWGSGNSGGTGPGAATWGDGASGTSGVVDSSNSLVGTGTDRVSSGGIQALANGHYVVISPNWSNGGLGYAGAVTWGNGTTGVSGAVSSSNSLVGGTAGDQIGSDGVVALSNGNYVVFSTHWSNAGAANAGTVTWGSGTSGISGTVGNGNSLVGSTAGDQVGSGGITLLSNGNYVVKSLNWSNGSAADAGAVTWGSGSSGISGTVGSGNSLVGSTANDQVGSGGVVALANGDYAVVSPNWNNGAATNAGAVTWGSGTGGSKGAVSADNSLIGSTADDHVGSGGVTALSNGNYAVRSPYWDNGVSQDVGAIWLTSGATTPGAWTPGAIAAAAPGGGTLTLSATHDITVNDAVTIDGSLVLEAGNRITLNAGLTSNAASNTALVLVAGSSFVNNAGANALQTPNGHWQVWSGDPAADTRGGLRYDFKQYNAHYGSSSILGSGNGFFYTLAPTITASLTGTTTKVYDGTTSATLTAANFSSSGAVDGDTVSLSTPSSGSYNDKNVAAGKNVTASGIGIAGASNGAAAVYGYSLASGSATASAAIGTIDRKALSIGGIAANNKVYDGTDSAALITAGASLGGLVAGDDVQVLAQPSHFSDKNAGTNKTVFVSIGLGGEDASNYNVVSAPATATADITPRNLTVAGASAANKVYDGTTAASVSGGTLSGLVAGDSVTLSQYGNFDSKDAGTGKTVTATFGLGGSDAGNYALASTTATTTADITPKGLTVAGASVANKVYDGTTAATVTSAGTLAGLVGGETLGLDASRLDAAFDSKDAGTGKTVTISAYALADGSGLASNYILAGNAGTTADITPRSLTVSGASAASKVYDGTTAASVSGGTLSGLVTGDSITLSQSGNFDSKDAGTGKTVTETFAIAGSDAGNYALASTTATTVADITPKGLTVSGASVANKVYDGTTAATVSGGTLSGLVSGDSVALSQSGTFDSKDAGTGKSVSEAFAIAGPNAGNYVLAGASATTTADITPKGLTIAGASAASKVYDGTTAAAVSGGTLSGVIAGDSVALSQSGSFDSKNIGTAKTVVLVLTGSDAGNYVAAGHATADITPKALSLTGLRAQDKTYDGTTFADVSAGLAGAVVGDSVDTGLTARFTDPNVGRNKTVTVTAIALAGPDAGNYAIAPGQTTTASIRNDSGYQDAIAGVENQPTRPRQALPPQLPADEDGPGGRGSEHLTGLIQVIGSGIQLPAGLEAGQ